MQLTPQQKDSLRILRNKVLRKLALAKTGMAYMRGTNHKTVDELTTQIQALNIILGE